MGGLNVARGAALAAAVALLAGCPGRRHYPGPYGDKVAADVPQIEEEMGVPFKRPPKLELRSRDQVRQFLLQKFDESDPQQELAGEEATYKLLGMLPDTMNLRKFMVDLLTEQVIGYYDPKTKVLYVVQDAPEDLVGTTIMHELVHALQDQYFNLDSLQRISGDDDRQEAAQAVIEGQATYEQMAIMVGAHGNIAAKLPGGWERIREAIRDAQNSMPIFSAAPMVIKEELLFPYINGADFVRRFRERRPGKLPFDSMPVSTQQVMHDSAYFGPGRQVPDRVTLPPIANTVYQNDMGEFGTRLFLYQHLQDVNAAARASAGWAGDRYALVRLPRGNGFVWATVWRTPMQAAQFVDALGQATQKRYNAPAPQVALSGARTYSGSGRIVLVTPSVVGGLDVVLLEDVPAGVSPALVDPARVTVARSR